MTIEEKLKEYILRRYHSLREFTIAHDIPYTTLYSIFRRGLGNSGVTVVAKICKALNISVDALADGEIKPLNDRSTVLLDETIEINDIIEETKDLLSCNGTITLDGKPIDKSDINSIINAIDIGVEMAKRKNKS